MTKWWAAAVVAAAVAGCGQSGSSVERPDLSGSDEDQVLATVRSMMAALEAGEGELACSLMASPDQLEEAGAERVRAGQEAFVTVVSRLTDLPPDATCEEAVESYAEELSRLAPDARPDSPEDLTAEDVAFTPEGGQVVPGADYAQVNGTYRGAIQLESIGGQWLVTIPFFLD